MIDREEQNKKGRWRNEEMDNREFLNRIKNEILNYLPEQYQDAEVFITQIRKNNDVMLDAMAIKNKEERVIPQIYLKEWYEMYQNGMEMEEILKEIAQGYLSRTLKEADSVSDLLMDYHKAKDFLGLKLVNKESNQKMLRGKIYRDMENTDLTALVCLRYQMEKDFHASIHLPEDMLSKWGIDRDTLYQDALQNTIKKNPVVINNMLDIILCSDKETIEAYKPDDFYMQPYEQYILTNKEKIDGATVLLYPNVLEQLAKNANSSFYILPSSIHEVILLLDNHDINAEELQNMVISVNREEVAAEEVLSNEVYRYDKKEHTLSMATNRIQTESLLKRLSVIPSETLPDMEMEREE